MTKPLEVKGHTQIWQVQETDVIIPENNKYIYFFFNQIMNNFMKHENLNMSQMRPVAEFLIFESQISVCHLLGGCPDVDIHVTFEDKLPRSPLVVDFVPFPVHVLCSVIGVLQKSKMMSNNCR